MKVVDAGALQAWILSNQFDSDAVVPPPLTCPAGQHLENGVCVPDVVTPPGPPSNWDRQALIRPLYHEGQQWGGFGYNRAADGADFPFAANKIYLFFLDPKLTVPLKTGKPIINIGDANQSIACKAEAWLLDAKFNKVSPTLLFTGGNASQTIVWPKTLIYKPGQCMLVQVTTTLPFGGLLFW